jgi:tetratricopeptide (TPR) repeat protein
MTWTTRRCRVILVVAVALACSSAGFAQNVTARASAIHVRATALERDGNSAAALSLLWEAAELAPDDADIQNHLGEALDRMGALDAAVERFDRAVSVRPGFNKARNNLVLALVKSGRGPEAAAKARAIAASAPGDPERLFTLGLALSEQDVFESYRTFTRLLQIDPRYTLARYNLALVLQRMDRLDQAVEQLDLAIASDPQPQALYTRGVIAWHQGDLDRAVRSLRKAIDLDRENADAYAALGAVLKDRGDWNGAIRALRKAIDLRPDLPGAHVTLARALQGAGLAEDARVALREAVRLETETRLRREALVRTSVGTARLWNGDLIAALDEFRAAVSVFEAYAPAHYQMGVALERLGQADAARAAFARAQQLNPGLVPPIAR